MIRRSLGAAAAQFLFALPAFAHDGAMHTGFADLLTRWTLDAVALTSLAVSGFLYSVGFLRIRRAAGPGALPVWAGLSFGAGWLATLIALTSPIDFLSEVLFSAHMTQHEILMLISAPLFVLGRPLAPMMHALPRRARARLVASVRRPRARGLWRFLTGAMNVWVIQAVILLGWHAPSLYDAAVAHEPIHLIQHAMFLGSAVLFWWALVHGRYGRLGYGMAVLYVFTTALYTGLLGAALTVAPRAWYPLHAARTRAWNLDPLADQQLAGLIMWIPAGAIFLAIGLGFFAAWLGEIGRRNAIVEADEPERL